MSDRCTTHKARACQKCAGDADASTALRDMEIERNILRITLRETLAEAERLAGVVAKVRELADGWDDGRYPNGQPMLSTADVVDRLNAALEQADRDAAEWREIHRGMRDDRDPS